MGHAKLLSGVNLQKMENGRSLFNRQSGLGYKWLRVNLKKRKTKLAEST